MRRTLRVRVPWGFWALLIGPLLVGAACVVVRGHGLTVAAAFAYSGIGSLSPVLVVVLALLVNGFGEETGWRGFLAERLLRRHSVLATSVLVTCAWATWHLPMFFFVNGLRDLRVSRGCLEHGRHGAGRDPGVANAA